MKFSSSHRRTDGRLETLEIEAESRAEAVQKLRAMGVVPLSVKEVKGAEGRGHVSRRSRGLHGFWRVGLGVVGGLIVGGIGWWMWPREDVKVVEKKTVVTAPKVAQVATEKKPQPDVKVSHVVLEETPPKVSVPKTNAAPVVTRERKFGEGGRPIFTNTTALVRKDKFDVFKHRAEFEMASLLLIKPGEAVIGDAHYGRGFMKSLKECLDEPIAIDEADDAEVNELKRSVTEMKEQVRGMLERGEDVGQTFAAARHELQELGIYRMGVEANLKEMLKSKDVLSERDMDDCIRAANTLLEEKGIAPVRMSPLTRHLLKRRIERQNKTKQTVE